MGERLRIDGVGLTCTCGSDPALLSLTEASGGLFEPVCTTDWATTMEELGRDTALPNVSIALATAPETADGQGLTLFAVGADGQRTLVPAEDPPD